MTTTDREAAGADTPPSAARLGHGLSRRALTRAYAFMEANLGEPLSLGVIAAAACVSRSHFARMFRLSTGYSPMAYLYLLRVERAKSLLVRGQVPLAELSANLGFSHHSHFSRVFRRHTGVSPRTFRHRYGGDWSAAASDAPSALFREAEVAALDLLDKTARTIKSEFIRTSASAGLSARIG